jgi:alcohol dehydrogenase
MDFQYHVPTRIIFGPGKLNELHEQQFPGKKALIVISAGQSAKANGYLARVQKELDEAGISYAIFDKVQSNPIDRNVMEGVALAKAEKCDFTIGLGGGSCLDTAKAIAFMVPNQGDLWDYMDSGSGKGLPATNPPLPIVAINTTSGTGSEVGPWFVTSKEATYEKLGFGGPELFPLFSIVDPELMLTVPPNFTAYQGFDVLFHAVEGYVGKAAYPISELYSLNVIELISSYLPMAVADGSDLGAREKVALADIMAGMVDATAACTSEHSLQHALSAYAPALPHGAGLIMISKAYYQHLAENHACDEKMIQMAKAMGKIDATKAMDFVTTLDCLQEACGVSDLKMSDYGLKKEDARIYAENARNNCGILFQFDPIEISDDDCVAILEKSYK